MGLKISSVLDRYGKCVSLQFPNNPIYHLLQHNLSIAQHNPPQPLYLLSCRASESLTKATLQGW